MKGGQIDPTPPPPPPGKSIIKKPSLIRVKLHKLCSNSVVFSVVSPVSFPLFQCLPLTGGTINFCISVTDNLEHIAPAGSVFTSYAGETCLFLYCLTHHIPHTLPIKD